MKLMTKRTLAVGIAALALVGGGGAAVAASQGASPSPEAFFDSVAKHLGISSEKLKDATKAAAVEQVDAALEAGTITKEQADALKTRIESSEYGLFGFGFRGHHLHGPKAHLSAAADYLGLTAAELREKLRSGQSLAAVAKAQGKSVDGLKTAMLDEAKTRLDKAVADGKLTRARADEIYENLESRIDDIVNRTGPPMGRHGFGGPGFGHGHGPAFGPGFESAGPMT